MKAKNLKRAVVCTALCAALTASASIGAFAAESKKTLTIPKVADGAVKIDAEKDSLYDNCEAQAMVEQNLDYFEDSPQDSTGVFYAVYDNSYIYIFVDITDANIDYSHEEPEQTWNRESLGVMFDFSYIRTEEYEYSYADNGDLVCYANLSGDGVLVTYHMYSPDQDTGLYEKIQYQTISEKLGHIYYEVALPIPAEVTPEVGGMFGLEVIACNADDGSRAGVVSWSPEGSEMWHYTDVCGTAVWGEYAYENEAPASEPTPAETPAAVVEAAPAAAPVASAAAPAASATAAVQAAPQTADILPIMLLSLIGAGCAAVMVKKH